VLDAGERLHAVDDHQLWNASDLLRSGGHCHVHVRPERLYRDGLGLSERADARHVLGRCEQLPFRGFDVDVSGFPELLRRLAERRVLGDLHE
jgi:hypothetical protein